MIRHSSSILLSLLLHALIVGLLIFAYKSVVSTKEEIVEKKVCIELCNVFEEKPITEPKPIIKKLEPTPVPVVKKEIIKKTPVEMAKIEPLTVEKVAKKEGTIEEVIEQINQQSVEKSLKAIQEQKVKDIESEKVRLDREYMQEHLARIVKLLRENLYYPRRARVMKEEGEVVVKFVLSKDATVHSIEVVSSKSKILSRSAIKTIEDLSGEFPKPKKDLTLHVPIEYILR